MNNAQHPERNNEPSSELFAIGALTAAERETFEEFVAEGLIDMEHLSYHLESFTQVCQEVADAMPAPRRALKEKILAAALAGERPADERPAAPEHSREYPRQMFIHAHEGEWVDMGFPGISVKILYVDPTTKRTTFLARLAPGAEYPRHRHMGVEECLVLSGDLIIDGTTLNAGDYTVTQAEKIHIDTHSETGCLLLLNSPMDDDFEGIEN